MSLFFDILVFAIFVICLISGIKKGFVRTVLGIVVLVAAIVGAVLLTPPTANYLNEHVIGGTVTEKVEEFLDEKFGGEVQVFDLAKLIAEKPELFNDLFETLGMSTEEVLAFLENNSGSADAKGDVSEYIAEPLSQTLSRVAAFAILFIVLLLILSIIVAIINLVVKIPVLKTANKVLGGVCGAVMGLAFAWGISAILCALIPHVAVISNGTVPASAIDNTFIVKLLGSVNLFSIL